MNTSQNKIILTGCAGLIGSHMAAHLIKKGYDVYGIDNLSGGYVENIPEGVNFACADLSDKDGLAEIFEDIKPDYVYHFAAYAAEGLSPFIRNFNYQNNLVCSANVINECIKNEVKKIIFTSSMAVYGDQEPPFTEDMQPKPCDPYGIAKYAVEMDLKQAHEQFGLRYSIVRPHNVIGIYQNIWDKYRNVIGIWIRRALNGETIQIFGDGEQKRAFSDVKYIMEPLEKLMTIGDGEIYNLGSDVEYSLNAVANLFDKPVEHLEPRHEVKNAYCSHEKAKKELGFKDETSLMRTMDEMYNWAKTQPNREIKEMPYEIEKGMYNYWK